MFSGWCGFKPSCGSLWRLWNTSPLSNGRSSMTMWLSSAHDSAKTTERYSHCARWHISLGRHTLTFDIFRVRYFAFSFSNIKVMIICYMYIVWHRHITCKCCRNSGDLLHPSPADQIIILHGHSSHEEFEFLVESEVLPFTLCSSFTTGPPQLAMFTSAQFFTRSNLLIKHCQC